ncbi:MAG: RHS repeat-associated core domain-containing protein [Aggregatilineales bacterium]
MGEYTDPTGLQHLRARYYDPTLGIFTQQDPVQGVVGASSSMYWNPYGYVGGNPVNFTDPSGQIVWATLGALALKAIGVGIGVTVTATAIDAGTQMLGGRDWDEVDLAGSLRRGGEWGLSFGIGYATAGILNPMVTRGAITMRRAWMISGAVDATWSFGYEMAVNRNNFGTSLFNTFAGSAFGEIAGFGLSRVGSAFSDALSVTFGTIRGIPQAYREVASEFEGRGLITRSTRSVNLHEVPSIRNGEFQRWFNSLTPDEFDRVWANPALRDRIEDRLRSPGGHHEWLPVSRTPKFKRWGITVEQIWELRTRTEDVRFNFEGRILGHSSTKAHIEIFRIVDAAPDYATYVRNLQDWADMRLLGGANTLPEGLSR